VRCGRCSSGAALEERGLAGGRHAEGEMEAWQKAVAQDLDVAFLYLDAIALRVRATAA